MSTSFDWLIVGAGFTGAVLAERIASQLDQRVLVIDRRPHLAGNTHDFVNEAGVMVHHYGPHIFHTNSKRVWDYLCKFTRWQPYSHRAAALVDDQKIPVPFNLNTLDALYPPKMAVGITEQLRARYGDGASVPILQLLDESQGELRRLAELIYNKIFLGFTLKRWGLKPEQLSPGVTNGFPIRINRDNRYFTDSYQALPADGYTVMVRRMLAHQNIHVELGVDYRNLPSAMVCRRTIFTGPMDDFFHQMHGRLPYRSARFEYQTAQQEFAQPVAQINYPNEFPCTRSIEFKHMTGQQVGCTTTMREFSIAHESGKTEPFYSIPRARNQMVHEKYRREALKLGGSVIFCGRLADYENYEMDQSVDHALTVFENQIARHAGFSAGASRRVAAA